MLILIVISGDMLQVAINSLETESNKQTITSNVSGSNLNNNNKNSANNQQQQKQKQTTESKESNFEYDDNEWDVGGIGDLIIDLDNDIEKSSGTVTLDVPKPSTEQISSNSSSSTSSLSSVSTPTIASTSLASSTSKSIDTSTGSGSSNKSQDNLTDAKVERTEAANIPLQVNSANAELKTATTEHHHKSPKQTSSSTTVGGSKSKISPTSDTTAGGTMSSNASGQGAGKAGNKLAIDHQATLDKGLKMKIKRTKPGTKTSEAKHEIVKAEQQQNGALSGADDSNSSSSGSSNGNKKAATQPSPASAAQALGSSGNGGGGGTMPPVSSNPIVAFPPHPRPHFFKQIFRHSTGTAITSEFIVTTVATTANHI